MGKLFIFLFFLAAGAGIAMASGYRFHAENIPYYLKLEGGGEKQKITFRDGMTLTGIVVQETSDQIKVDSEGAAVIFPKTEIESIKSVPGANPWVLFLNNYQRNKTKHPLITYDKAQSFGAKMDHMILEPSRIADDIRKKHPEITSSGHQSAMMENSRDALLQLKIARERIMAASEKKSKEM